MTAPDARLEALLNDLTSDFEAIRNRLAAIEGWRRLADKQRSAATEARNRAEMGRVRIQAYREGD